MVKYFNLVIRFQIRSYFICRDSSGDHCSPKFFILFSFWTFSPFAKALLGRDTHQRPFHHPFTQVNQASNLLPPPMSLVFNMPRESQLFQTLIMRPKKFQLSFPDSGYKYSFQFSFRIPC